AEVPLDELATGIAVASSDAEHELLIRSSHLSGAPLERVAPATRLATGATKLPARARRRISCWARRPRPCRRRDIRGAGHGPPAAHRGSPGRRRWHRAG